MRIVLPAEVVLHASHGQDAEDEQNCQDNVRINQELVQLALRELEVEVVQFENLVVTLGHEVQDRLWHVTGAVSELAILFQLGGHRWYFKVPFQELIIFVSDIHQIRHHL